MFSIITKKEYWECLDSGVMKQHRATLKDIQDAYILFHLRNSVSKNVLELGGGYSRVLPVLAQRGNECWNVDKFEGAGAGPVDVRQQEGVKVIRSYMGDFSPEIPENYFDYVISISAVEHIPGDRFESVIMDCHRVLKPGGVMLHAIDLYLLDRLDEHHHGARQRERIMLYKSVPEISRGGLEWLQGHRIDENVTASAHFACNQMDQLYNWHKVAPQMRQIREIGMSVSLVLGARKSQPS